MNFFLYTCAPFSLSFLCAFWCRDGTRALQCSASPSCTPAGFLPGWDWALRWAAALMSHSALALQDVPTSSQSSLRTCSGDDRCAHRVPRSPNLLQCKRPWKEEAEPFAIFPSLIISAWSSKSMFWFFPTSFCLWRETCMLFRNNA